jgi:hypothetical protein
MNKLVSKLDTQFAMAVRFGMMVMPLGVLAAGCMSAAPDDDAAAVSSTEQDVKTLGFSWGATSSATVALSGTSTATQTCFLSGVSGDLIPNGTDFIGQGVGVNAGSNGQYNMYLNTNQQELEVAAQCVNSATARTNEVTWSMGESAKTLGSATPDSARRCFLTRVSGSPSGDGPRAFSSSTDFVKVWSDGSNWYIGGVLSGPGSASAVCVDVTADYGTWIYQSPDPGTGEYAMTNVAGASCPLQYVGGHFDVNDWEAGVYTWLETGTNQFSMHTSHGHTGWSTCVK